MKRRTLILALAIVMILSCTLPAMAEGTRKLTSFVRSSIDEKRCMEVICEELNIDMDIQVLPDGEQGEQVVRTRVATHDLPDIIRYYAGTRWLLDLMPEENLMDLTGMGMEDGIIEDVRYYYMVGDKLYAIPCGSMDVLGIYYNKEVFEKANGGKLPDSLEEMYELCGKIKALGVDPFYITGKEIFSLQCWGQIGFSYDQSNDPTILDRINAHTATFSDAPFFTKMNQLLLDLKQNEYINSDYMSGVSTMAYDALVNGTAAMIVTGSRTLNGLVDVYGNEVSEKVGFMHFPVEAGKLVLTGFFPNTYSVPNYTKVPELALEFMKFYASEQGQQITLDNWNGSIKTAYNYDIQPSKETGECQKQMLDTIGKATVFQGFDKEMVADAGDFGPIVQQMMMDDSDPIYVAEELQKAFEVSAKSHGIEGF